MPAHSPILPRMRRATFKAEALLFLAAAIWGAAFVAQRVAMDHIGPLFFNYTDIKVGLRPRLIPWNN